MIKSFNQELCESSFCCQNGLFLILSGRDDVMFKENSEHASTVDSNYIYELSCGNPEQNYLNQNIRCKVLESKLPLQSIRFPSECTVNMISLGYITNLL